MKDALGHGSNARGLAGQKMTAAEQRKSGAVDAAFHPSHQNAVNAVGGQWRLNSHTHEIVSPTGEVAARMRLGKNNGLAVDVPGMGKIHSSGGPSIHDAVAMPDYRAGKEALNSHIMSNKGSFPAEHISGALHFLTGKEFPGHTVRRVK